MTAYKKINVAIYCPVEHIHAVREAMLKAGHEKLMRKHEGACFDKKSPCEGCIYEDKDSDVWFSCSSCARIGGSGGDNFSERGDGVLSD